MDTILLSKQAKEDIARLRRENPKFTAKLWDLLLDVLKNPVEGLGQPEALKGNLQGWWSRRITPKHRLIYKMEDENLIIISCYGHYQGC